MKTRINILIWIVVIIASYFCLAPTYRCDREATKCSENGCQAQPGELTVGCTKILKNPYWTKTSEAPWPDFCHAYTELNYSGTSGNWTGTDSVNCTSIEIENRGAKQLIYLKSVSSPYPFPLSASTTISRDINQEFRKICFTPVGSGTDGNVTIRLFK